MYNHTEMHQLYYCRYDAHCFPSWKNCNIKEIEQNQHFLMNDLKQFGQNLHYQENPYYQQNPYYPQTQHYQYVNQEYSQYDSFHHQQSQQNHQRNEQNQPNEEIHENPANQPNDQNLPNEGDQQNRENLPNEEDHQNQGNQPNDQNEQNLPSQEIPEYQPYQENEYEYYYHYNYPSLDESLPDFINITNKIILNKEKQISGFFLNSCKNQYVELIHLPYLEKAVKALRLCGSSGPNNGYSEIIFDMFSWSRLYVQRKHILSLFNKKCELQNKFDLNEKFSVEIKLIPGTDRRILELKQFSDVIYLREQAFNNLMAVNKWVCNKLSGYSCGQGMYLPL